MIKILVKDQIWRSFWQTANRLPGIWYDLDAAVIPKLDHVDVFAVGYGQGLAELRVAPSIDFFELIIDRVAVWRECSSCEYTNFFTFSKPGFDPVYHCWDGLTDMFCPAF